MVEEREDEYLELIQILGQLFDEYYSTNDPRRKDSISKEISLIGSILAPESSTVDVE